MGVHVCLQDASGREDPRWDSGRMGGDRELVAIVCSVATIRIDKPDRWEPSPSTDRPVDLVAFRQRLRDEFGDMNADRWELLCDILESDPKLGIYFSF